jgi:hypothetical protein
MSTAFIGVIFSGFLFLGISFLFAEMSRRRSAALGEPPQSWGANWLQGMSTEMTGALIATILFGVVIGYLEERDNKETLRNENIRALLMVDMGGLDNAEALHAVDRLRQYGWLTNGTLKDTPLIDANLANANLESAYLRGVIFTNAILTGADLRGANLRGAIFTGADLAGAQLDAAVYDEKTVLPDGSFWAEGTDMRRFTDPNHAAFWRSDDPASPAYGQAE